MYVTVKGTTLPCKLTPSTPFQPQMLACGPHRLVLAFELEGFGGATLAQEEEPGAVDGPVAEVSVAGEVKGPRG